MFADILAFLKVMVGAFNTGLQAWSDYKQQQAGVNAINSANQAAILKEVQNAQIIAANAAALSDQLLLDPSDRS